MARLAVDVDEGHAASESPVPDRAEPATTVSGVPIAPLYSGADLARIGFSEADNLGRPGEFPFTRGVHEAMYRGRLWTMRQFAGFGTPRQTNERFRFLLEKGQTGLSTAFDLPTLMGLDSDSPASQGEVGRLGVAVDTLDDMRQLFAGIDLEKISVSMTINAPAAIVMAFYLAAAREKGVRLAAAPRHHSERHPQGVPRPERNRLSAGAFRAAGDRPDRVLHAARARSGTRSRSAAITFARPARRPLQELAFTLADGLHYVEQCLSSRPGDRPLRPAAELLLQRPQRRL